MVMKRTYAYWACALMIYTSLVSTAGYKVREYEQEQTIAQTNANANYWRHGWVYCSKNYQILLHECKKVLSELKKCKKGI